MTNEEFLSLADTFRERKSVVNKAMKLAKSYTYNHCINKKDTSMKSKLKLTGKIIRRTSENFCTQSIKEYDCKILSARRGIGCTMVILHSLTFSYADGCTYEEDILLSNKEYRNLLCKGKITLPFAEYKC